LYYLAKSSPSFPGKPGPIRHSLWPSAPLPPSARLRVPRSSLSSCGCRNPKNPPSSCFSLYHSASAFARNRIRSNSERQMFSLPMLICGISRIGSPNHQCFSSRPFRIHSLVFFQVLFERSFGPGPNPVIRWFARDFSPPNLLFTVFSPRPFPYLLLPRDKVLSPIRCDDPSQHLPPAFCAALCLPVFTTSFYLPLLFRCPLSDDLIFSSVPPLNGVRGPALHRNSRIQVLLSSEPLFAASMSQR